MTELGTLGIAAVLLLVAAAVGSYFVGGLVSDLRQLRKDLDRLEAFVFDRENEISHDEPRQGHGCMGEEFDPESN